MIDPDELREQRRAAAAAPADQLPTDPVATAIAAQLARQDLSDRGWRWLARWRSDRHDFARIAGDEGLQVAEVRAAVDAELRREGTTLVAAEAEVAARQRRAARFLGGARRAAKPELRLLGGNQPAAPGGRIAR